MAASCGEVPGKVHDIGNLRDVAPWWHCARLPL